MIIGIALVVDELHKGPRLVCRYPEAIPSSILNAGEELLGFHKDYVSLSPDNFARLFRPKAAMFNKVLEIIIDDLHYISYPTPCSEELSDIADSSGTNVISLFNIVIASVRESSLRRHSSFINNNNNNSNNNGSVSDKSKFRKPGLDPIASVLGLQKDPIAPSPEVIRSILSRLSRALLEQEKKQRYVSKQVAKMLTILERTSTSKAIPSTASTVPSTTGLSRSDDRYDGTGTPVSTVNNTNSSSQLLPPTLHTSSSASLIVTTPGHGSLTSSSVISPSTSECTGGLALTDIAPNQLTSSTTGTLSLPQNSVSTSYSGVEAITSSCLHHIDIMMANSTLANELRVVYHGLIGGVAVNVTINETVTISAPLIPFLEYSDNYRSISAQAESNRSSATLPDATCSNRPFKIRPHETVLLVADPITIYAVLKSLIGLTSTSRDHSTIVDTSNHGSYGRGRMNGLNHDFDLTQVQPPQCTTSASVLPATASTMSNVMNETKEITTNNSTLDILRLELGGYVSPLLLDIISTARPTSTISELSEELQEPYDNVVDSVVHLCSWGLVEVISTITLSSCYQVHPEAPRSNDSTVAFKFQSSFSGISLGPILSFFNGRNNLAAVFQLLPPAVADFGLDIVIWLLRYHMLVELQTILFTLPEIPSSSSSSSNLNSSSSSSTWEDLLKFADGNTSVAEIAWREGQLEEDILSAVEEMRHIVGAVIPSESCIL